MVEFNKPDVKASRVRRCNYNIDLKHVYEEFCKKNPEFKNTEYNFLKNVIKGFSWLINEKICTERYGVELPEGLGFVFVASVKMSKDVIDMPKSAQVGKKVLVKNWETDGMSAKIFYTNWAMKYKFSNREIWSFNGNRDLTRAVSDAFKKDWKKYVQPASVRRVTDFYKTYNVHKTNEPFVDEEYGYNEFDI